MSNEGNKNDKGKLRYDLIPVESLLLLSSVYTMGAEKYDDNNWRKGIKWSRIYAAIQRHLNCFWQGENNDKESGLPHLAHAAWGCFTLIWYSIHRNWFDDRYTGNVNKPRSNIDKDQETKKDTPIGRIDKPWG